MLSRHSKVIQAASRITEETCIGDPPSYEACLLLSSPSHHSTPPHPHPRLEVRNLGRGMQAAGKAPDWAKGPGIQLWWGWAIEAKPLPLKLILSYKMGMTLVDPTQPENETLTACTKGRVPQASGGGKGRRLLLCPWGEEHVLGHPGIGLELCQHPAVLGLAGPGGACSGTEPTCMRFPPWLPGGSTKPQMTSGCLTPPFSGLAQLLCSPSGSTVSHSGHRP